ncbi:MAG: hypothetical protein EPN47_19430 [Acidobacteria bacterium]|nr:MAG: hypothetical protein EPN47_19430 [Acidobacteriota bacterium]
MGKSNGIATTDTWRRAAKADREARAEHLALPSGATIMAARPEPLEWVMSGRIPQGLLAVALEDAESPLGGGDRELTREEILDLASFAARLVAASVVDPPIGDGPGEIALDDIPIRDRAFIFEWACCALSGNDAGASEEEAATATHSSKEDLSSASLERFRQK